MKAKKWIIKYGQNINEDISTFWLEIDKYKNEFISEFKKEFPTQDIKVLFVDDNHYILFTNKKGVICIVQYETYKVKFN